MDNQPNNPLHGVKLADILDHLVEVYGWDEMGDRININCFNNNPSIKSSLGFLRKTPWAREKVERLYLHSIGAPQPPRHMSPREKFEPRERGAQREDTERSEVEPVEDSDSGVEESPWDKAKRNRESRG